MNGLAVLFFLCLVIFLSAWISLRERIAWPSLFVFVSGYLVIRLAFGRYFTTIDESYYLSLLGDKTWYEGIVSGYITPFLLHLVHSIGFLKNPVYSLYAYSLAMGLVYLFTVHHVYRVFIRRHLHVSQLVLFMTPLFWWAIIQVRPQQMGLLLGIVLFFMVSRFKFNRRWHPIATGVLFLTLIFAHVLSFLVFSFVVVVYLLMGRRRGASDETFKLKFYSVSLSILLAWAVFLVVPFTHPTLVNMRNLVDSMFRISLLLFQFKVLSELGLVLFLLSLYYMFRMLPRRLVNLSLSVAYRILGSRFFMPIGAVVIVIAFMAQYHLGAGVYNSVYQGSVAAILLFQLGNIFFSIGYLEGIRKKLLNSELNSLDTASIIILLLAGASLGISVIMPKGNGVWGFHNWMIRVLQYWVFFAASAVGYGLYRDFSMDGTSLRRVGIVIISALIFLSVLNTARIPSVYNYDATWSPSLVESCQLLHGIYVPRTPQTKISRFVTGNLLRACKSSLGAISSDIDGATPAFYISTQSMTIGGFLRGVSEGSVYFVSPRGSPTSVYFMNVVPESMPLYINGNECPVIPSLPVILLGGPAVNPCVSELEGSLPVKVTSTLVSIDGKSFSVPTPRPWWNATRGIFVIQAAQLGGNPVLVIEGTNLDATLAGIYYYANFIMNNSESLGDVHYIVGLWEEQDNSVIPLAKGSVNDKNGFSLGDRIKILAVG